MPELKALHIAIIAAMTVVGAIVGWLLRGSRSRAEKAAVNAGWQEQINAQRVEHDRLTDQNKGLMEQISQYQASNMDAKNRAKELSIAVQEAYARRDRLQREIKNIRASLEASVSEREQLQSDISAQADSSADSDEKDERIRKLQAELKNWQNRLPPLIEKFRQRNEDAEKLATDLAAAEVRIAELTTVSEAGRTRIEPVQDPEALTDGRDASNEPIHDGKAEDGGPGEDGWEDDEPQDGGLGEDDAPGEDDEAGDDKPADDKPEDDPPGEDDEPGDDEPEDSGPEIDDNIGNSCDRLQRIKGVGPAIEKTLNEMGIFHFRQIADMSEYDIDRIAKRLKGFRSRIYREDWIGQARELCDQESSD